MADADVDDWTPEGQHRPTLLELKRRLLARLEHAIDPMVRSGLLQALAEVEISLHPGNGDGI